MKEFRVGAVLSRSFSIWLKNLVPFTILTLLVFSPLAIYTLAIAGGDLTLEKYETWQTVESIGESFLSALVAAAICYGTFEQLRGRHATMGRAIAVGLKLLLPVLGVGLLVGLCIFGGILLLIVPGVIILCMLWVAVPVAVVEKPGVIASLKRSAELTSGYKGQIFGIWLVLFGIVLGASYLLFEAVGGNSMTVQEVKTYMVIEVVFSGIVYSLQATAAAVSYHDLRELKEGVDVEELVKVFE